MAARADHYLPAVSSFASRAPRPRRTGLAVCLALLTLAGCRGSVRAVDHTVGETAGESAPIPPLPPAIIAVPITVPMPTVRAALDGALPAADSLDRAACVALGGVLCHQYVYRRTPLDVQLTGPRLAIATQLEYRARVAVGGRAGLASCGYAPQRMRRAAMRASTELYWRADWRLGTRETVLEADLLDPCEVTALRIDAATSMRRILDGQLARASRTIDSLVPTLADLRPVADSLWRALQEPVALDTLSTVWLITAPEQLSVSDLRGTPYAVHASLRVVARPRVVIGERPRTTIRPLPALTLAPEAQGIDVPIEIRLPFAEVARQATAMLAAETQHESVRVRELTIQPNGRRVDVRVSLEGSVRGVLHLTGEPRWDSATRTVRLEGFRHTLESEGLMSHLKVTLAAPLVRRAIESATGGGRMPLGEALDEIRTALNATLNQPLASGAALAGGVRDIEISNVHLTADAFLIRARLTGAAGVYVR